jgi:hypothetical protein
LHYNGNGKDLPDLFLYTISGKATTKMHSMPLSKDDKLSAPASLPSQL